MIKQIKLFTGTLAILAVPLVSTLAVHADTTPSTVVQAKQVMRAKQIQPAKATRHSVQPALVDSQYQIVWGDTLSQISVDKQTPMSVLISRNNIANPDVIYAGDMLYVPTAVGTPVRTYIVQNGDTLDSISAKTGIAKQDIQLRSHIFSEAVTPGQTLTLELQHP
jgi:LysM domain.